MLKSRIEKDFPIYLREFCVPHDGDMIALMQGSSLSDNPENREKAAHVVRRWMETYGLFQGIEGEVRDSVSEFVLQFVPTIEWNVKSDRETAVREAYTMLYEALYDRCPRAWTSAVSKLLWCRFPDEFVIYDSFVERSITVLQWLDACLEDMPFELGVLPKIRRKSDVEKIVEYYMRYQGLVYKLYQNYHAQINALCETYPSSVRCPHNIRLFDRFLLGLGNPAS